MPRRKPVPVDPALVHQIGAHIMAASLANRDLNAIDPEHYDALADHAYKAAVALVSAVSRNDERAVADAKAADEAEAAADAKAEADSKAKADAEVEAAVVRGRAAAAARAVPAAPREA